MSRIYEKTVYIVDNQSFDSQQYAEDKCESDIGDYLEKSPAFAGLHPGEKLKIVEFIAKHRDHFQFLLNY